MATRKKVLMATRKKAVKKPSQTADTAAPAPTSQWWGTVPKDEVELTESHNRFREMAMSLRARADALKDQEKSRLAERITMRDEMLTAVLALRSSMRWVDSSLAARLEETARLLEVEIFGRG